MYDSIQNNSRKILELKVGTLQHVQSKYYSVLLLCLLKLSIAIAVTHVLHAVFSVSLLSKGNMLKVISLTYFTLSGSSIPFPSFPRMLDDVLSATVKSRLFRFAANFILDELQFLSLIISSMFKVRWGSSLETKLAGDGGVGSTGAGGGMMEDTAGDGGVGSTGAGGGMMEDTAGDGGVGSTGAGGGMMEDTAGDGMSEGCVILLMSTKYDNTVRSRLSRI